MALKSTRSTFFLKASRDYAEILARLIVDQPLRQAMGEKASRGTKGRTWHEAMEMCVSSYREAITLSKSESSPTFDPPKRPIRARLGRVVRRLGGRKGRPTTAGGIEKGPGQHGGAKSALRADGGRESESVLRFKTVAKILVTLCACSCLLARRAPLPHLLTSRPSLRASADLLYVFYSRLSVSAPLPLPPIAAAA